MNGKNNYLVEYFIDDGYAYHKQICVISAMDENSARAILHDEIGSKLGCVMYIVDNDIKITKCENDIIIYSSIKFN